MTEFTVAYLFLLWSFFGIATIMVDRKGAKYIRRISKGKWNEKTHLKEDCILFMLGPISFYFVTQLYIELSKRYS